MMLNKIRKASTLHRKQPPAILFNMFSSTNFINSILEMGNTPPQFIVWLPEAVLVIGIFVGVFVTKLNAAYVHDYFRTCCRITGVSLAHQVWTIRTTHPSPFICKYMDVTYFIACSKLFVLVLTWIVIITAAYRLMGAWAKNLVSAEIYLLLLFSLLFMFLLISSSNFLMAFVCIEGLGFTLYIATGITKSLVSAEAAVKYFIASAIGSSIFLLGIGILFSQVGSLNFLEIKFFLSSWSVGFSHFEVIIALNLILFSMLLKLGAFPCHWWVADVYDGAFAPIAAFFATSVKACFFIFTARLIFYVFYGCFHILQPVLLIAALGSILVGSIGAFYQTRIKRFLGFSSVSQSGFILLGFCEGTHFGLGCSLFYLVFYTIAILFLFSALLNVVNVASNKGLIYISDLSNIRRFDTSLAVQLTISLISLAGIPPLGGFLAKFLIFSALASAGYFSVLLVTMLLGILSSYYYLNIVKLIWMDSDKTDMFIRYRWVMYEHEVNRRFTFIINFLLCFVILYEQQVMFDIDNLARSCMFPLSFYNK